MRDERSTNPSKEHPRLATIQGKTGLTAFPASLCCMIPGNHHRFSSFISPFLLDLYFSFPPPLNELLFGYCSCSWGALLCALPIRQRLSLSDPEQWGGGVASTQLALHPLPSLRLHGRVGMGSRLLLGHCVPAAVIYFPVS